MDPITTHENFIQAVQNHLKEREGCPVMVIVHSPNGLEMQLNFIDFSLQIGLLRTAEMTTEAAFKRQIEAGFNSGENQMMVSAIKDACDPNKKKVN
jgi:hypothetical protein